MKKLICLVLAADLCCGFAACTQQGGNPTDASAEEQMNQQTTETQETSPMIDVSADSFLVLSTLEEYKAYFLKRGGYPENFISYEMLSPFGTFISFQSQSYDKENPDYSYCRYEILDASGLEIAVTIEPKELPRNIWAWKCSSAEETMMETDMRRNYTAKKVSNVMLGNFQYHYSVGKLRRISWVENGKEFDISADFTEYSRDLTDTLIGKLLNKNTAQAALEGLGFRGEADPYKDVELSENPLATLEIYTLDEYEKHFQAEGGYPEGFLQYEAVSKLGTFEGFIAQSYTDKKKEYSQYSYMLRDPAGFLLSVNVIPASNKKWEEIWPVDKLGDTLIGEDLRKNDTTKETANITPGMYTYFYRMGQLEAISGIMTKGRSQVIMIVAPFHTYPTTASGTLIGRMLNAETADAAIKELGIFME